MKFLIIFAVLFTFASARPGNVETVENKSEVSTDSYSYDVKTSDGSYHHEEGKLKDVGTDHEAIVVRGTFSWTDILGRTYTVNYVADENGYQPEGAHLPVAPQNSVHH